jgi:hypothetical protein
MAGVVPAMYDIYWISEFVRILIDGRDCAHQRTNGDVLWNTESMGEEIKLNYYA